MSFKYKTEIQMWIPIQYPSPSYSFPLEIRERHEFKGTLKGHRKLTEKWLYLQAKFLTSMQKPFPQAYFPWGFGGPFSPTLCACSPAPARAGWMWKPRARNSIQVSPVDDRSPVTSGMLPPRVYVSRKLESGIQARIWTQALWSGTKIS